MRASITGINYALFTFPGVYSGQTAPTTVSQTFTKF